MKTVVNSSMVQHLWAHQSQSHARNGGGSVSFHDQYLFSYSTVIGYHCGDFVLLTRNCMSSTTSKHTSGSARACSHLRIIYSGELKRWNRFVFSEGQIIAELLEYYYETLASLPVKRSAYTKGMTIQLLTKILDDLDYLRRAWQLQVELPELPDNSEEILASAKQYKAEKAELRRIEDERREKEWSENARLQRIEDESQYQMWLNGEPARFPSSYRDYSTAQLTIRGETVYTSQGAEAPLSHVKKALDFYFLKRWPYQTNGHRIPLGSFVLDSIDAHGNVKAGCHRFSAEEIERFYTTWALHFEDHRIAA